MCCIAHVHACDREEPGGVTVNVIMAAGKREYQRLFCEHCSTFVSKSTWYNHYDLKRSAPVSSENFDSGGDSDSDLDVLGKSSKFRKADEVSTWIHTD